MREECCVCGVIFLFATLNLNVLTLYAFHTHGFYLLLEKFFKTNFGCCFDKAMPESLRELSIGLKLWMLCYILHRISGMIDSQRSRGVCCVWWWPFECSWLPSFSHVNGPDLIGHVIAVSFTVRTFSVTQTTASLPLPAVALATALSACMKRILGNLKGGFLDAWHF